LDGTLTFLNTISKREIITTLVGNKMNWWIKLYE
jgi:hypothetical protein